MNAADESPTPRHIADWFLEQLAPHEPTAAQALGRDADDRLSDFSPEWCSERYRIEGEALERLRRLPEAELTVADLALSRAMQERLESDRRLFEVGFTPRLIAPLASPAQFIRESFDGAQIDDSVSGRAALTRLESVPAAVAQLQRRLEWSRERGRKGDFSGGGVVAKRQIDVLSAQIRLWLDPNGMDFFRNIPLAAEVSAEVRDRAAAAGEAATGAFVAFATFLEDDLRRDAPDVDAVGELTYLATTRSFLGADVDLDELNDYGWSELHRLVDRAREVSVRIAGGAADADAPARAAALLDSQQNAGLGTESEIRTWLEGRIAETIDALDGAAFDLPADVREVDCDVTRATSGVVYYTPSAPDGSRPGRVVWTIPRDSRSISTWQEVTSVHHEGVPGHHLEHSINRANASIHPWQRYLCEVHGYAEGWAHYSEQLAEELGLLRTDGELLGMLLGQIWRAVRVVGDIGLHTGRPIPKNRLVAAREWTPELVESMLVDFARTTPQTARFEVDRYYAWPGQALAFKVGQKLWNDLRARAEQHPDFALKRFHRDALSWGPMGLAPLAALLEQGAEKGIAA